MLAICGFTNHPFKIQRVTKILSPNHNISISIIHYNLFIVINVILHQPSLNHNRPSITRSSRSPIPQYHTQTLLSLQLYSFFFFNIYIYYICSPVSLHTCVNSPFDQLSTNHVNVAKFHHDNSFRFNP